MTPDTLPADWTELMPAAPAAPPEPAPAPAPLPVHVETFVTAGVASSTWSYTRPQRSRSRWDVTDVLCGVTVAGGVLASVSCVVLVVLNWSRIWPFLLIAAGVLLWLAASTRIAHCPGAWHK